MNQTDPAPIGSEGNVVEDDETHVSGKEVNKRRNKRLAKNDAFGGNQAVPTPVERDGRARYFHMPRVTTKTLLPIGVQAAQRPSNLTTDGACVHPKVDKEFASHSSVDHVAGKFVRMYLHCSNPVEIFVSTLKCGHSGLTFNYVSEAHHARHLSAVDFRGNQAQENRSSITTEPW